MSAPAILVFAGSLRTGSYNVRLATAAVEALEAAGGAVTRISLGDYPLPLYDADLEATQGVPDNARRLAERFVEHHGIFIAAPEYNAGPTPLLKNTIDWVSRVKEAGDPPSPPYRNRAFGLGAASPGGFGGYRGLMWMRLALEIQLSAIVIPQMVSVPAAANAFDDIGVLTAERPAAMLKTTAAALVEAARRFVPEANR